MLHQQTCDITTCQKLISHAEFQHDWLVKRQVKTFYHIVPCYKIVMAKKLSFTADYKFRAVHFMEKYSNKEFLNSTNSC